MKPKRITILASIFLMMLSLLASNVPYVQAASLEDALGSHDIVIDNSSPGVTID
ncbi:hypothetical protein [Paenibacillus sp. Soil766]|uniref:hypothetical protein n=1 Tax=Paenibacillus sp. Soil766 TaxID=1736404 RepID=UPI0012FCC60A|nr:hypothetical protein [Paenibacillus sp. Soil766]